MNTIVLTRKGARSSAKRRPRTRRRLLGFLGVVSALFVSAIVRVALLQTVQAPSLSSYGETQRLREIKLPASRGFIFDRNGIELAQSVPSFSVWLDPHRMTDKNIALAALAETLRLKPDVVDSLVTELNSNTEFAWVARQVDEATAEAVKALELKGVYLLNEPHRYLPADKMARSLLGSTDADGTGISGLELKYDELLTGTPGYIRRERDQQGRTIPTGLSEEVQPIRGQDLVLTIDQRLQYQAEQLLIQTIGTTNAKGGIVVIADTKTGDLLAVANVRRDPTDPTSILSSSTNAAFVDTYEPGSVAKIIAASGALEEGTTDMDKRWHIESELPIYDTIIRDDTVHKSDMTVRDIIAESSNIGTVKLAQSIGSKKLETYFRSFGFGSASAVNFPGETPGLLPPSSKWNGTQRATIAYGQGVGVTAVQLTAAMNTIANNGVYVSPRLVRSVIDRDGIERPEVPSASHQAVRPEVAADMTTVLREVVCTGTARGTARIPGYQVAGKTGTAFKAQDYFPGQKDGYKDRFDQRHYVASFVGYVPAEAPRVTVLVSIDEPDEAHHYGYQSAAPLFTEVAAEALRAMKVPPSGSTGC
jgi:cell division protein FtsI (penicillin-binding protein 3)